jgi:hypothetical protein
VNRNIPLASSLFHLFGCFGSLLLVRSSSLALFDNVSPAVVFTSRSGAQLLICLHHGQLLVALYKSTINNAKSVKKDGMWMTYIWRPGIRYAKFVSLSDISFGGDSQTV